MCFQDMEKWAKSMNAQKQSQQDVFKRPIGTPGSLKTESAAADAGFSMFSKPVSVYLQYNNNQL